MIMKNILIDLAIIFTIIFGGYLCGFEELKNLLHEDIGTFIAAVGMLWAMGSFVRLGCAMEYWFISIFCGLAVFIFGASISMYGLFYAFFALGVYFAIIAYFISGIVKIPILLVTGLLLMLLGWPLRNLTSPTFKEEPLSEEQKQMEMLVDLTNQNSRLTYP
jgi:hypothetical protein